MIKYKLTTQNLTTFRDFQWKLGEWVKAKGKLSNGLCSSAYLHCYDNPLLAILHNPIHANIENPRLFEVKVKGGKKSDGLKCGYRMMKLVKEIPIPKITAEQKAKYAIYCALEVCHDEKFVKWANDWLLNKDRSPLAIKAWVIDLWPTWAAWAAWATNAATRAVTDVAWAKATATNAATCAATAADAAWVAAEKKINFVKLAEKAVNN